MINVKKSYQTLCTKKKAFWNFGSLGHCYNVISFDIASFSSVDLSLPEQLKIHVEIRA